LTTNLDGHWKEFYNVFEETLLQLHKNNLVKQLKEQQEHRGNIQTLSQLFSGSGFTITTQVIDKFEMRFLDGSSFLRHHFIKLGWLLPWKAIVPEADRQVVFELLEANLNVYSAKTGELRLTVPMALVAGQKIL
jgi:hypothetical protein